MDRFTALALSLCTSWRISSRSCCQPRSRTSTRVRDSSRQASDCCSRSSFIRNSSSILFFISCCSENIFALSETICLFNWEMVSLALFFAIIFAFSTSFLCFSFSSSIWRWYPFFSENKKENIYWCMLQIQLPMSNVDIVLLIYLLVSTHLLAAWRCAPSWVCPSAPRTRASVQWSPSPAARPAASGPRWSCNNYIKMGRLVWRS